MNIFEIKQYSFTYPQEKAPALNAISLSLEEGKFYVLCGENGSGKSTLLRQLKTALTPKGKKVVKFYIRREHWKKFPLRNKVHR